MKKKLLKMHYKQKITPFLNKSLLLSLGCLFTFNLLSAQDKTETVTETKEAVTTTVDSTAVTPVANKVVVEENVALGHIEVATEQTQTQVPVVIKSLC